MPILACKRVIYYSRGDERAFFEWIRRISCISEFVGAGDTLYLHVRRTRISDENLRDLLALFNRYEVAMKQLAQFESPRNRPWFKDRKKYWYPRVWGVSHLSQKAPMRRRLPRRVAAKRTPPKPR